MPKVVVHEIESDEEPQAKKPKQDRSPLVVLNGECTTKKRQLTLKDMVSPKTITSTFKPLPSSSPSSTKNRNSETSPKECKSGKKAEADVSTLVTTPSRGVKRKSTVSDKSHSPPHQHKIHRDTVEETEVQSDLSTDLCKDAPEKESGKRDVETPKRARKRSRETEERESPEATKSDKENNEKSVPAASSKPSEKTPIRKPTLESMLIRKTPKRAQNVKKSDELRKTDSKTDALGTEKGDITLRNDKKKLTLKKKMEPVKSLVDEGNKSGTSAQNEEKIPDNSELLTANESCEVSGSSREPRNSPEKVVEAPVEESGDVSVATDDEIAMETSNTETVEKSEVPSEQKVGEGKSPTSSSIQTPASKKVRPLSAKQKKIQEEREKKRREIAEEKERKRLEREKEKGAREEAKRLELAKKEEAKQKREEERKQREEEKKQREEEKKQREEEKKLKDAEKDAEKKRKQMEEEEEKRLREEKKLKEQEKFKSFFVVKKPNVAVSAPKMETIEKKFRDFVLTPNMAVAPIRRTNPVNTDIFATALSSWSSNIAHIKDVIADMNTKQKLDSDKLSEDMEIITILDPKQIKVKRKILHFHENYRPAYCGSWRKTSTLIGPRRPFGQDKTLLEYDYDSDDDWEEPEEGEDITSEKEDEKEEEKDEDEDEDDGFFVPHGYLSDDEGDEDCSDMTQEAKKKRLEQRRKQFEDEQMSKERGVLSAKIVGPAWQNESSDTSRYLAEFQAVWSIEITEPLDPFTRTQPVAQMNEPNPKNYIQEKRELPESGYGMLIRFLHGSPIGMSRAVQSFLEMWHSDETREKVSKRQLTYLIQNLMKKVMRPGNGMKLCWYASDEVLEKYDLKDLIGMHCEAAPEPIPPPPMNVSLLKFTKTTTAEEDLVKLKQQLEDQQAQHKQQQVLQQALIQAVRQQEAQKALQKSQMNTLKTFLSSGTARRVPLIPVNTGSGETSAVNSGVSSGVNSGKASAVNSGKTSAVNSATSASPAENKSQPTAQAQAGNVVPNPRRVTLVPLSVITSPVVNVDDDSK